MQAGTPGSSGAAGREQRCGAAGRLLLPPALALASPAARRLSSGAASQQPGVGQQRLPDPPADPRHPSAAVPLRSAAMLATAGRPYRGEQSKDGAATAIDEQRQGWLQPPAFQQRGAASASCHQGGRAKGSSGYLGILATVPLSRW